MVIQMMSGGKLLVEVVIQVQSMVLGPTGIQKDRSLDRQMRQRRMLSWMTSLAGDEEMGYTLTRGVLVFGAHRLGQCILTLLWYCCLLCSCSSSACCCCR